jgi:hypothetical protein
MRNAKFTKNPVTFGPISIEQFSAKFDFRNYIVLFDDLSRDFCGKEKCVLAAKMEIRADVFSRSFSTVDRENRENQCKASQRRISREARIHQLSQPIAKLCKAAQKPVFQLEDRLPIRIVSTNVPYRT